MCQAARSQVLVFLLVFLGLLAGVRCHLFVDFGLSKKVLTNRDYFKDYSFMVSGEIHYDIFLFDV